VVLGPSGVCSADIDFVEHAERVLSEIGIDLDALRKTWPTICGSPSRYRMMFQAPPGVVLQRKTLVWPPRNPDEKPPRYSSCAAGQFKTFCRRPNTRHQKALHLAGPA
jgi:putative DNA primase/helicase